MCLTNHSLFLIFSFVRCIGLMWLKGVVNKTYLEDKIGFKGLQWAILNATVVVVYEYNGDRCVCRVLIFSF